MKYRNLISICILIVSVLFQSVFTKTIDALISWNNSQSTSETQLRISIPTIKALASAFGANYQPAIQNVLKDRENELDQLHTRFLLGSRYNVTVHNRTEILQAIANDFLLLDHWQEVKYPG